MQASHAFEQYWHAAQEVIAETLWPTHCAVCGKLGFVLCPTCRAQLHYIDQWLACPKCGAPFGRYQCCECNSYSLHSLNRIRLPFSAAVSAVALDKTSARIVRTRKDQGERRLATPMAFDIASAIPPAWIGTRSMVSFVPSAARAQRQRGFCHAQELAQEVAKLLQLPCVPSLVAASMKDQRHLGRQQRSQNTAGRFRAKKHFGPGLPIILVDDVYTTGSTAMAATDALLEAGAQCVYVATFART